VVVYELDTNMLQRRCMMISDDALYSNALYKHQWRYCARQVIVSHKLSHQFANI